MANVADQVASVLFTEDTVYLRLANGRVVGNPLSWHRWLAEATPEAREDVELYERSACWPTLDDGLDIDEMIKGEPPHRAPAPHTMDK